MTIKDYYRLMGVEKDASAVEIKKAYRRLVMAWHPDRNRNNPESEDQLKIINEAYGILGDAKKRQQYDLMRQRPRAENVFHGKDLGDDITAIFRAFYGMGMGKKRTGGCGGGFGRRGCGRRNW